MPDYANLPILTELEKLYQAHKAKPLPYPEAKREVQVILNKYVKLGMVNAKARLQYVTEQRDSCKKMLEKMQSLLEDLKAPNYIPEIYKLPECKAGLDVMKVVSEAVHKDATTMYAKMGEFRANWGTTVQKIVGEDGDISFINSFIAARTETMKLGTEAMALAARIEEYLKRAELIASDAEKARNGAASTNKDIVDEANKLVKAMEDAAAAAEKGTKATAAKLKSLVGMKKQATYTGKEHKVAESFVTDIEAERKGVAGQSKTAEQTKARLKPLIDSKGFLLTKVKERMDAAWKSLEESKAEATQNKLEADKVLVELKKRLQ